MTSLTEGERVARLGERVSRLHALLDDAARKGNDIDGGDYSTDDVRLLLAAVRRFASFEGVEITS